MLSQILPAAACKFIVVPSSHGPMQYLVWPESLIAPKPSLAPKPSFSRKQESADPPAKVTAPSLDRWQALAQWLKQLRHPGPMSLQHKIYSFHYKDQAKSRKILYIKLTVIPLLFKKRCMGERDILRKGASQRCASPAEVPVGTPFFKGGAINPTQEKLWKSCGTLVVPALMFHKTSNWIFKVSSTFYNALLPAILPVWRGSKSQQVFRTRHCTYKENGSIKMHTISQPHGHQNGIDRSSKPVLNGVNGIAL